MVDLEEIRAVVLATDKGDPSELAAWLRSGKPLLQVTRDILADLIEGKVKRTRGRKPGPASNGIMKIVHRDLTLLEIEQATEAFKAKNRRAPRTLAEAQVAERHGISLDQLNRIIHPRKAKPRKTAR